jgi:hypothetical protein
MDRARSAAGACSRSIVWQHRRLPKSLFWLRLPGTLHPAPAESSLEDPRNQPEIRGNGTDPVVQREPAPGSKSVLRSIPRRSELFEVAVDLATDFLEDGRIILSKFINRAIRFGNIAFKNIADRSEGYGLPAKHEF